MFPDYLDTSQEQGDLWRMTAQSDLAALALTSRGLNRFFTQQLYDAPRLVTRKQMRLYLRTFTGGITPFARASRCKRMTSNRPREVSRRSPRIVKINSLICCHFARPPFTAHLRLLRRLGRLQQPTRSSVLQRMLPLLLHYDPQIQRLLRLNPRPSTPPRTWLFPSNLSSHRGRTRLHLSTLYGRHRP